MATYSSNTTIKVNAAIASADAAKNNPSVTITTAANVYAIVQIWIDNPAPSSPLTYSAVINGLTFVKSTFASNTDVTLYGIYLGPSSTLTASTTGGNATANSISITGVSFINTP